MNTWVTQLLLPSLAVLPLAYFLASLMEYIAHRYLMHEPKLLSAFVRRFAFLRNTLDAHATGHHKKWYKEFDYEPDAIGRHRNICLNPIHLCLILLSIALLNFPLGAVSPFLPLLLAILAVAHYFLWNRMHSEMHIPRRAFFHGWRVYRRLAMHHYLHHAHPNTNYNAVFPLVDWLFGTQSPVHFKDVRQLLRLGHLAPRNSATQLRLAHRKAVPPH